MPELLSEIADICLWYIQNTFESHLILPLLCLILVPVDLKCHKVKNYPSKNHSVINI